MTPQEIDRMTRDFSFELQCVSSKFFAGDRFGAYNLLMDVADRIMDVPEVAFGIK